MKLEQPVNANYAAVVVKITAINKLDNCDNVVGVPVLGYQAIVSNDIKIGDIGIVFPAETQLSEEFCHVNNLYRDAEKNADPTAKGYVENTRRVKAMRFRGHRSDALFMPLNSLFYTGFETGQLKVGDVFDKLRSFDICQKYVIKQPVSRVEKNKQKAKERRVDDKFLPQHFDTDNYFRNADSLPDDALLIITAKLHGTSVRLANTLVKRKLSFRDRIAKRFGVTVKDQEYDYIAGSRRVIKDPQDSDHNHFYKTDVWTETLEHVRGMLPESFIVYGELVGWTRDGSPIQTNYTYGIPAGTSELYVYRVAYINTQGLLTDLAWDQVKEFCKDRGLKHVPELGRMSARHFKAYVEDLLDISFNEFGYKDCPPVGSKLVDEGVCVRIDGLSPYILKAKSPVFLQHETKLLDKGVEDMESDS